MRMHTVVALCLSVIVLTATAEVPAAGENDTVVAAPDLSAAQMAATSSGAQQQAAGSQQQGGQQLAQEQQQGSPAVAVKQPDPPPPTPDETLEGAVIESLQKEPELHHSDIAVRVNASVVTLTGRARTSQARRRAEQVARGTVGAIQVRNLLAIGDNGIDVAEAKLFDQRSLALMLESAEAALRRLQFFDQAGVAKGIATLQGVQVERSAMSLTASGLPTAATSTSVTSGNVLDSTLTTMASEKAASQSTTSTNPVSSSSGTSGGTDESLNTVIKDTSKDDVTTKVDRAAVSPQVPTLPAAGTLGYTGGLGIAATDLLAEQAQLTHQVINLRLLLEGAISDRARLPEPGLEYRYAQAPTQRAVLGFQLATESLKAYRNSVAHLELTIFNCRSFVENGIAGSGKNKSAWTPEQQEACRAAGFTPKSLSPELSAYRFSALDVEQRRPGKGVSNLSVTSANVPSADELMAKRVAMMPASLAMLIPQAKTYNVAAVTEKSRNFGFAAVVSPVTAGFAARNSKEALFLVRDTDTVSFVRSHNDEGRADSVTFGWQLRPVLGNESVEPGMRQVFAVVSVPSHDPSITSDQEGPTRGFLGAVRIVTSWRRYDAKTGTVDSAVRKDSERITFQSLVLPPAKSIDYGLAPSIWDVAWSDLGTGKVLVHVDGEGLTADARLVTRSGFVLPERETEFQSEIGFRYLVPADDLLTRLHLVGRWGPPSEISRRREGSLTATGAITAVDDTSADVRIAASWKITLTSEQKTYRAPKYLVALGQKVYGVADPGFQRSATCTPEGDTLLEVATEQICTAELDIRVPTKALAQTGSLLLFEPFGPETMRRVVQVSMSDRPSPAHTALAPSLVVTKGQLIGKADDLQFVAVTGEGFRPDRTVVSVNGQPCEIGVPKPARCAFRVDSSSLMLVTFGKDTWTNTDSMVVQQFEPSLGGGASLALTNGSGAPAAGQVASTAPPATRPAAPAGAPLGTPVIIALPKKEEPAAKPKLNPATVPVHQGDSLTLEITGENLKSIKTIALENEALPLKLTTATGGATVLKMTITSAVTKTQGLKELAITLVDGSSGDPFPLRVLAPR